LRVAIIENPNVSTDIIMRISDDKSKLVRISLAESTKTPSHVLALLAKEDDCELRKAIIKNPNTPPQVKDILEDNPDKILVRPAIDLDLLASQLLERDLSGISD
jgi:hypothetical protein